MDPATIIAKLEPLLLPRRIARMRAVLATRTDHATFVFERMTDPHNLSAALRSLDAFSFQDAHWIAPDDELGLSRMITKGTDRWLTLAQHADTATCFAALRAQGYRILASAVPNVVGGESHARGSAASVPQAPRVVSPPLDAIDLTARTAFVFGNEHAGVAAETIALADGCFHIEMFGFAESLNLSVACAITAFHARSEIGRLVAKGGDASPYGLPEAQRTALYVEWLKQSVRSAERVLGE